ncbi:hypothetical protein M0812_13082 [Anaeramoeba flamelloides]|uniref:Uncharacterized protein n=1 Tax=Anaeramoeba flamelloides TaxID=1746091 RepID=A0AAV7ZL62_9EUKA|nr:hypothetical protein M0812_13082 [Anaeramoeba flamelloides]
MNQQFQFQNPNINSYSFVPRTPSPVSFFIQSPRNSPVFGPISSVPLQPHTPFLYSNHKKTNTKSNKNFFGLGENQSSNTKQIKDKMHIKSQVEKEAIQALCLLGTPVSVNNQTNTLFEKHNRASVRKQSKKTNHTTIKRKRSGKTVQFETIGTKITVKLDSPISKCGSLKIKFTKGSPRFATPSTYPKAKGLQIRKN